MRWLASLLLVFSLTLPAWAGLSIGHVEYIGGTYSTIPENTAGMINAHDNVFLQFVSKRAQVRIPYERINLLEYGQRVGKRYLVNYFFSRSGAGVKRDHLLTIGFEDNQGHQQALVFKIEKNDVKPTLAVIEARTGRQIQFQDDESRSGE